jgi:hypothetical protein
MELILEVKYFSWEKVPIISLTNANKPKIRFASKEDYVATQYLKLVSLLYYF